MSEERTDESAPEEPEAPSWWEEAVGRLKEWMGGLVEPPPVLLPIPVRRPAR